MLFKDNGIYKKKQMALQKFVLLLSRAPDLFGITFQVSPYVTHKSVRERQREIERQRERDRDRERQRQRERGERERERKLSKLFHAAISLAAWKVSKYGVFYGTHFPVFGLNTGKYRPEKAPYLDNFQTVYAWLAQIKKVKTVLGNKKYCN